MIEITHKNGKTNSTATCDYCGFGYEWERFVPIPHIETILTEIKWKAGTQHLCPDCETKKEAPCHLAG